MFRRFKNIGWQKKIQPVIWSLLLLIALLHILGIAFFYETLFWYDILLHGLGGFWLGLVFCRKRPALILVFVFVVGFLWELAELIFDAFWALKLGAAPLVISARDSLGDLAMDMIGGAASILVFRFFRKGGRK